MKTVIIAGDSSLSMSAADLLNPSFMKLIGIADTRQEAWNVLDSEGNVLEEITGMPVMPVDMAIAFEPELIVIAVTDPDKAAALRYLVIRAGFNGDIIFLDQLSQEFSVKCSMLRRLTDRLNALGVDGAVAELGCYQGDTSWQLNVLMPDRKLYLFDTFQGFDSRDVAKEAELGCSRAKAGQFGHVEVEKVMARMANPQQVTVREGWFPETAFDLEDEKFCLVYMDASLYLPTFAGFEFFFPRMAQGGVIVLAGAGDSEYGGVSRAISDLEAKYGAFLILPIGDLKDTLLVVHP